MSHQTAPFPPLLLSRKQAAEVIGYSPRKIDRLRESGVLPAVLVGGKAHPRYRLSEVLALIERED